jgi:outer membrane immunogenic protein/high affinity Mn2+ porin
MRAIGGRHLALAAGAMLLVPSAASADSGWTGCYAGAHVGYARGDADATDSPFTQGNGAGSGASWNTFGPPYDVIGSSDSSALGGGEVGCDYQIAATASTVVVGIAVDISGMDLSDTGTSAISVDTNASFDVSWIGSVRGRLGWGTPAWLVYATGGYAFADIDVRAFDFDAVGVMDVSGGGTESGWVLGGGVEHKLGASWSLSLEYLHYEFDGITATGEAIDPVGTFPRFETDLEVDVVRAGFKWRP